MPDLTQEGLAARGLPERLWADEDTWFQGPGITKRAAEYVRADVVAKLIREAEARGMERAAEICEGIRTRIANGPMPEGARFDYEQAIRAEAAALRKDEEPK